MPALLTQIYGSDSGRPGSGFLFTHKDNCLCNCSHMHVKEQYGLQQDPMTVDHLDNIKAENPY